MVNPSRRSIKIGVAVILAAAVGCISLPAMFELCTVGDISGPVFLLVAGALTTLLGAGMLLSFSKRDSRSLFVISSVLFLICFVTDELTLRAIPLEVAAVGSVVGTVFSLLRRRPSGRA